MLIPWLKRSLFIICIFQILSGAPPLEGDQGPKVLWSCQVDDLEVKFTQDGIIHWGAFRFPTGTLSASEFQAATAAWNQARASKSWGEQYLAVTDRVAAKRLSLVDEGKDGDTRELRRALDRYFDYGTARIRRGAYAAIEDPGLEASETSGTPLARVWKRRLESVEDRSTERALAASARDASWIYLSYPGTLDLRREGCEFALGA